MYLVYERVKQRHCPDCGETTSKHNADFFTSRALGISSLVASASEWELHKNSWIDRWGEAVSIRSKSGYAGSLQRKGALISDPLVATRKKRKREFGTPIYRGFKRYPCKVYPRERRLAVNISQETEVSKFLTFSKIINFGNIFISPKTCIR